ncbi:MAG: carbon-nitrogen hydrolase family protein [Planctomycetota bacterium]|jgi:predicted amidohydrolase
MLILFLSAVLSVLSALLLWAAFSPAKKSAAPSTEPGVSDGERKRKGVTVGLVQFFPKMGDGEGNRRAISEGVRMAKERGAEIVVLPECALQGYMEADGERVWAAPDFEGDGKERPLTGIAEPVPGPGTRFFGGLAGELSLYLLLPLIEIDPKSGKYFNTALLLDPRGEILLHYRKTHPWTVAEYAWASKGSGEPAVVDTPLGRIGVMICFDVHILLAKLSKAGTEIILWPIWWVDHSPELWFEERMPALCREHRVALVAANRAVTGVEGELPGGGFSCIVDARGRILSRTAYPGPAVVVATLPVCSSRMQKE